MTTRFAGSSSLDARRRRRLASEPEPPLPQHEIEPADPSEALASLDEPAAADDDAARSWLPRAAWKAWLLFLGVIGIAAAIVFVGHHVDRDPAFFGRELSALLSLETGRLSRVLGSLLLLVSGQLALVIWAARARSTKDFSGRYDVWAWAAAAWFVFALAHETRAHLAWSEAMTLVWEPDFWNKTILSWFAPALGTGGVLWLAVRADARRCRSAHALVTLAGLAWCAGGLLALGMGSVWLGPWRGLVTTSVVLAGHVLGFGSMLLHARFVTHVCNDPPAQRTSRPRSSVRSSTVTSTGPAVARPADDTEESSGPADIEVGDDASELPSTEAPRPVDTAFDEPVTEPAAEVAEETGAVEVREEEVREEVMSEPVDERPAPDVAPAVESPAEAATLPIEEPASDEDGPPPEMLRGLSKRQKKRVRREWREAQRAEQRRAA